MPTSRARDRTGSGRRAAHAARAALLVGLVVLTSCGTIPPGASGPGHPSATPSPRTAVTPGDVGSTGPVPSGPATSSPRTSAGPRAPHPTGGPTGPAPSSTTPAEDVWVGRFHDQEIRVPRGHGARMSFTFDDGPWPGSTTQVLGLLEQHHVRAVFCLIGNQAAAQPALVHREVAAGHELCDHSRDHDIFMGARSQAYVDAEVGDGLRQIRRAAPEGTPVGFYRQPGGTWDPKVVRAMDAHDLDPLRWSDDPRDWSRPGSLVIVRRVVSKLRPGAVVLMHDGGGDRSQSVEALRFLLHAVVAAGWKPVLAPHVTLSPKAAAEPQ